MNKDESTFIFADCAINPNPNEQELANIAIQAAQTAVQFGVTPDVAMLSYSTYGSGKGEMVDKVQKATNIAKEMAASDEFKSLEINIDGELQADAALVEKVANLKAPGSSVAGHAKVLIFPDLNAGNIAYKLVQRLGGYEAFGPVLQGLKAPINDLSRGCSAEDIVYTVALTAESELHFCANVSATNLSAVFACTAVTAIFGIGMNRSWGGFIFSAETFIILINFNVTFLVLVGTTCNCVKIVIVNFTALEVGSLDHSHSFSDIFFGGGNTQLCSDFKKFLFGLAVFKCSDLIFG
jgi:hypothetical protein